MPISARFSRDANNVPITTDGIQSTDSIILSANNTSAVIPIFGITETIEVRAIWGVVTTILSSNITTVYFRMNDATTQASITSSAGATMSSFDVGSLVYKNNLAAGAANVFQTNQTRISEPATRETIFFSPFIVNQKAAVATNIEFLYTTTNTPATGAIKFYMRWLPLSDNANVTPL